MQPPASCSNCITAQTNALASSNASVQAAEDIYANVGMTTDKKAVPDIKESVKPPTTSATPKDSFSALRQQSQSGKPNEKAATHSKSAEAPAHRSGTSQAVTGQKQAAPQPSLFARFGNNAPHLKLPTVQVAQTAKFTLPTAGQTASKAQVAFKESQTLPLDKRDAVPKPLIGKETQRAAHKNQGPTPQKMTSAPRTAANEQNQASSARKDLSSMDVGKTKIGDSQSHTYPTDKKHIIEVSTRIQNTNAGSHLIQNMGQAKLPTVMQGILNALGFLPFMGKNQIIAIGRLTTSANMPTTKNSALKIGEGTLQKLAFSPFVTKVALLAGNIKSNVMNWIGKLFSAKHLPETDKNQSAGLLGSVWNRIKEKWRKKKKKKIHQKDELMDSEHEVRILEPKFNL